MKFTDDSIALLKIYIASPHGSVHCGDHSQTMGIVSWPGVELKALLHRLECAEAVAEYGKSYTTLYVEEAVKHHKKLKAWRKAAGK